MDQPSLDHHYIVLHLGGDKRVSRRRGRDTVVRDIADRSLSTIEAGSSYSWHTEGPIAFARLYLEPKRFAQAISEVRDCDPAGVHLHDVIGEYDPLLANLMAALVRAAESDDLSTMEREAQLDAALVRLYERQARWSQPERRIAISPHILNRVKDYVGDHLRDPISLDDLAGLAGYSRFHFARGFQTATGLPPYAYILRERIALACDLLAGLELPVHSIARASGFTSHPQFASRFRQLTGISPSAYRKIMR
jgi:AraC family transcriptional regulator